MNVQEINMEKSCGKFKNHINFSEKNVLHIAFSRINMATNQLLTISTDYDWHLRYWAEDMYKLVGKRCINGSAIWNDIDGEHNKILKEISAEQKIDLTSTNNEYVDILSIASNVPLSNHSITQLASSKPKIGYLAQKIWSEEKPNQLKIPTPTPTPTPTPIEDNILLECNTSHHSFGALIFSDKEMQTINWLLQLKSLKEIAWNNRCSQTAEKRRVESIKRKLKCENQPISYLFLALKKSGITQACLSNYITYQ